MLRPHQHWISKLAVAMLLWTAAATHAAAQSVTTDAADYYPGDVVIITGSGWWPGEQISMRLDQHPVLHDVLFFEATADSTGAFQTYYSVQEEDLGTSFDLTATGLSSGLIATTFFTDSPKVGEVIVGGQFGEICSGGSATFPITVNRGSGSGSSGSFTATLSIISTLPAGVTASFSPNPVSFAPGQTTRPATLTLTATGAASPGETSFTVRAATSANDFATDMGLLDIHNAPAITCPAPISRNSDPGQCGAIVSFSVSASGTPAPTLTYSRAPGTQFPVGTTTVTATASNSCGTTSCTFTVTVLDTEKPSLSVSDVTRPNDPGLCSAIVASLGASATDNCTVATLVGTRSDGAALDAAFPKGTTTITWLATDTSGNTATATQHVTVNDTQNPTVAVSDITRSNDPGLCAATIVDLGAAAADNCAIATLVGTRSDGASLSAAFPKGTTTITWLGTDTSGNTATATQLVTINDNENPILVVSGITRSTDPGICAATINDLGASATDNCGIASLNGSRSDGAALGAAYPKGTTNITWLATDTSGNTATATQLITINDTEKPAVTASDITRANAPGLCSASIMDLGASAADNCGIAALDGTRSDGAALSAAFPKGTTTITWLATDTSGNTATATQLVTVNDTENPTLTVSDLTRANDPGLCAAAITDLGAEATDNCAVASLVGTRSDGASLGAAFPKGTTTITWLATDTGGNTATATQLVSVADSENPTLTVSPISRATDPGLCSATIADLGASATDNCGIATLVGTRSDGAPLGAAFPEGTTTVTWVATDVNGRSTTATQTVTVEDRELPTLTAPAPLTLTTGIGSELCGIHVGDAALGAQVSSDNCSVSVTRDGVPAGNLFPVGTTTITYTATDPSGNHVTAVQTVTVSDDTPPSLTSGESFHDTDAHSCGAMVTSFGLHERDNCGIQSLTGTRDDGHAMTDMFPVGVTTITWTATDIHGNAATATWCVHVQDHESPTITAPAAINATTGPGAQACGTVIADATLGQASANDNCSALVTTAGVPNGNLFPVGTTTITWTATDPSGNAVSATQAVTVADDTPPTLTVPASLSLGTGPGATTCGLVVSDVTLGTATATDNCSASLTRTGVPAGNLFPKGTTTITWIATDPSGNSVQGTQLVTVADTTPPRITVTNITVSTDAGLCSASIASLGATAADNCGTPALAGTRSDSRPLLDPFPKGTTTITWTATDAAGLSTTATQTVSVTNGIPTAQITGPASGYLIPVGTTVSFSGTFTDNAGDVHTAAWACDASTIPGTVNEAARTVAGSKTFTTAGVYLVTLTVTDACGAAANTSQVNGLDAMIVVYDPNSGFVTGGGWIQSPVGAYASNPALVGKANFGFVSKYKKGATTPTGETEFQFKAGDLNFHSTSYDWLVVAGARAQYKGAGTINGAGDFGFLLSAVDGETPGGGGKDKFRIKITDRTSGTLVYDNMMGAADTAAAVTVLGGGSIAIQANGGKASASIGAQTESVADGAPSPSALAQNHPNPFNPETAIRFTVSQSGHATLRIFNIRGALVRTLVDGYLPQGAHESHWNGADDRGGHVPSGVYYALLSAPDGARARIRMVLIK